MLIRLFWGCGAVTGAVMGAGQRWVGPMGDGLMGAIMGTHHYHMTSQMPSSAGEEGFQISNIYVFCAL